MTEGKKDDRAKPDFRSLLTYDDIGAIGSGPWLFGASKYGEKNYLGLFEPDPKAGLKRMVQAAGRHCVAGLRAHPPDPGFNIDPDTGKDHRYHELAELLMMLAYLEAP